MGIQRSQEDAWTKEMQKWEMRPVLVNGTYVEPIPYTHGGRGGAPFQEYPKMLFRAESRDGGPQISDSIIVDSEQQERLELGRGWSLRQEDAIALVEAQQLEFAKLAANRAYQDRLMTAKAQAEARALDETTMQHLPEIPRTRTKPRGRPRKTADAVEG